MKKTTSKKRSRSTRSSNLPFSVSSDGAYVQEEGEQEYVGPSYDARDVFVRTPKVEPVEAEKL